MALKFPVPNAPKPTKFKLKSPRGASLATRVWPVPGGAKPKAIFLIVHGGGWHSGYFEVLVKPLVAKGYFCAAYDQINCGYSEPEPGAPPGYMFFLDFDCLVEDVFAAMDWAQQEAGYKDLPMFLLGESFGGPQVLEAAFQAAQYKQMDRLAGVVTCGGLITINPLMLPPSIVVAILAYLAPYYPKLALPSTDFESSFDDAFGDKDWAKTARADPKIDVNPKPTLASGVATLTIGKKLLAKASTFPDLPLLCIHGERDCRTAAEGIQEFADKAKGTVHLLDTDGHQLFQDVPEIQQQTISIISKWMDAIRR